MKIESLNKDIILNPYTRSIDRSVKEAQLKGVMVNSDGKETNTQIPAINSELAEELEVKLISGLSQDEIDKLSLEDYEAIKKAIADMRDKKKSGK